MPTWWRRRERELSAYVDGELGAAAAEKLAERLAFASGERRQLERWRRLDRVVRAALAPPDPTPDPNAAAALVLEALDAQPPLTSPTRPTRWTPVVVVAGLLVTAGLAMAGCRHRMRS